MNKNILWLPSWYPNTLAPFDGDFIQRHAQAVSMFQKVTVIYIKKDENAVITKDVTQTVSHSNNLTEMVIFYHPVKTGFKLIDKFLSAVKYIKTFRSALKKYIAEKDKPALAHVHIALRAGIQALWLNFFFNVPFIISEHWTGYLPEARFGLNNLGIVQKKLLQKIFNNAKKITVVSDVLGKAISNHFGKINYTIVPNVVNTSIFSPELHPKNSPLKFIHISSLEYQKNLCAIIEAFSLVRSKGYSLQFIIYGPEKISLKKLVIKHGLQEYVQFKGEVPQSQLASDLRTADALILYSFYETFGCVVIEANACGVPAILSDLPVFKEYVTENQNGIFVATNNPAELARAIENFILGEYHFNSQLIAKHASARFNYSTIGAQFAAIYENL